VDSAQGIYDITEKKVILFTKESGGGKKAGTNEMPLDDPRLETAIKDRDILEALREELEILEEIVVPLDRDLVMQQKQTPVFFGSGYNNFGVQQFLDKFLALAQVLAQKP
jgi:peptide chain release factor 3